ncbi:DUF6483 family protein [Clostridium algidicarnis]|uniref:Uncharacterized protein n=2 Tax=Clostridium algidicarnis TaxID=37659 RepID=A0ABS6C208_9CLOT|nr:DUF6483 family protein [Clostridium algidicarnis]MBB6631422.1 hypothetical protein [Clostridium algidicarnis]MBU3206478.1 hypothetical protein [Clostridium algidicarnis]MBU3219512.1 hypothetical protein [Clostridium algidicarnis]MBU3227754.1 hypothetical protein [Clostridium algidicarnis]MBU3251506.1 hypothetical protein [Clostridium algidicarnis]
MNIEKLIKQLGKALASMVMQEEVTMYENIDFGNVNSLTILPITLKNLILKGEYNKAENVLFNEVTKHPSKEVYSIAEDFYNILLSKSDDELIKNNFSKCEIYQGLKDIKNIIEKSKLTKF